LATEDDGAGEPFQLLVASSGLSAGNLDGEVHEPASETRTNETVAMPFATEAGQFQVRGLPTVMCGPGNVDMAHKPDEFITVEQVEACMHFMRGLAAELSQ